MTNYLQYPIWNAVRTELSWTHCYVLSSKIKLRTYK